MLGSPQLDQRKATFPKLRKKAPLLERKYREKLCVLLEEQKSQHNVSRRVGVKSSKEERVSRKKVTGAIETEG